MNLPNLLTLFRMVAAFVFMFYGLTHRWNVAFPIFCIAALTDMIDGSLARLMRQRTQLGAFLDPTADKMLMVSGFLALTSGRLLPFLFTAIMIGRDLMIVVGVVILRLRRVRIVYRPTYLSKITTFFQIATIVSTLLIARFPHCFGETFLTASIRIVTIFFTIVSGIQYFEIGLRILKDETSQTGRQ